MPKKAPDKKKQLKDLRAKLARLGHGTGKVSDHRSFRPDDLRRTIQKQKSPNVRPASPLETILYQRNLPRTSRRSNIDSERADRYRVVLEDSVTEGREIETPRGKLFEICLPVSELEGADTLGERFGDQLDEPQSSLCRKLVPTLDPTALTPSDIVFMDIESTGLNNSPLFLIGVMLWQNGGFEVRQFFARNYAEEAGVIIRFIEECYPRKLLVTFNGKSYDMPFIRARAAANGLPFDLQPPHFDLLHESRRVWKDTLPDCKLQTLERHICKRNRHGDIPGSEIPDAYHAYVRTNDAWQMVEALKHNMLDLVTLADIMTRFPEQ
ncbi:MAG: ribonuclease H-like domain-containing protein [Kiritimatiellia bacterium]|jgi:uncharacterized protein YprB with RNaseH-like and TPR domain|nr:ribonuclease H-like domain-containing protein [Kiritimatiellia bacterium]MDP6847848.1 ribonuclease H-like domain-containing protein [Kiritimatiellia bacterium]